MNEIMFTVEEAEEGGYTARALGHSVFVAADGLLGSYAHVQDAVRCHFEDSERPKFIRLKKM